MLATYAGQGSDLQPWLKGAEINRDRNLRLQYLAGMAVNENQGKKIFDDILLELRAIRVGQELSLELQPGELLQLAADEKG